MRTETAEARHTLVEVLLGAARVAVAAPGIGIVSLGKGGAVNEAVLVARFTADGTLDRSFGEDGLVRIDGPGYRPQIVLGPNGKYWDGSLSSGHANFTATTQTWVTVSGTSNWSQSWRNSTFNGVTGSYTVSARASDLAGTTGAAVSASFTTS